MFDNSFYTELRQTNVSNFPEKTKERVEDVWKSCQKDVKHAILDLAGVNHKSYNRVCKVGTISARLALALAQTVNITPYYFTGEEDEKQEYSDKAARQFIKDCGYNDILIEYDRSKPKRRKPRQKKVDEAALAAQSAYCVVGEKACETMGRSTEFIRSVIDMFNKRYNGLPFEQISCINGLTNDEMAALLISLAVKAKAGGEAATALKIINLFLLKY